MNEVEVVPRFVLRRFMEQHDWDSKDGDFAEVGVWEGHSARVLVDFCLNGKKLFLFDTFEGGLPDHDERFDNHHRKGEMKVSMEIVKYILKDFTDRVIITRGVFPDSATIIKDKKFCFVNIDTDLYKGTKDCLEFFYPRLVTGGVIAIQDDYQHVNTEGVTIAADVFLQDRIEEWKRLKDLTYFIKR